MNAEPAAAAGVTAGNESQIETAAGETPAATPTPTATEIASSDRLKAILEDEGLPPEEVEEVTKGPHAKKTETPESDRAPEGARGGKAAEGEEEKAGGRKSEVGSQPKDKDEEEAITPEQAKSAPWAMPRINKITAQREAARTEAKQLREQLAKATRPTVAATKESPLADVNSPEEMQAAIWEYENLLEWAELNPDGLTEVPIGKDAEGKVITRDYSAQEMATIRAKTGRILREHVPQRLQLLRQQWQHEQIVREKMPAMFEKGTEENRFLESGMAEDPRNSPGFHNFVRWAWMGRQADIEASKAEGGGRNADEKVTDPKVAPFLRKHPPLAPGVPEARVRGGDMQRGGGGKGDEEKVTQAKQRVEAGEGEEAEVDFIESLRESQAPRNGEVLV